MRTHRQACDPNPGPTRPYVDFVPTTSVRWHAAGRPAPAAWLQLATSTNFRTGSPTGRLPASRTGTEHAAKGDFVLRSDWKSLEVQIPLWVDVAKTILLEQLVRERKRLASFPPDIAKEPKDAQGGLATVALALSLRKVAAPIKK